MSPAPYPVVKCPYPQCPARRIGNGTRFQSTKALNAHLGRSKVCQSWITMQAVNNHHHGTSHAVETSHQAMEPEDYPDAEGPMGVMDSEEGGRESSAGPEPSASASSGGRAWLTRSFVGAGLRYAEPVGTAWERRKSAEKSRGNIYHLFKSDEAYDIAQWAIRTKQTLSSVNDLLKTRYVS